MSLLQRGLMFVLAAGTLAIPSSVPPETRAGGRAAVTVDPQTVSSYTPADKEYYLTESQMDFIRPGLKVTLGAVTDMAPGKKPIVELTMTDDFDQPIDKGGDEFHLDFTAERHRAKPGRFAECRKGVDRLGKR